jgi:hypothetical protein
MSDKAIYNLYPQVVYINGGTEAFDVQNNQVQLDWTLIDEEDARLLLQQKIATCKSKASELLYETDWTTIPDVADPANTPYLTNQSEFIAWRSQIRVLAINPVVDPVFPTKPNEIWG